MSTTNLLGQTSLLFVILPFFGKKKQWEWLLMQLNKSSNAHWKNKAKTFDNLQKLTDWKDSKEEISEL